MHHDMLLASVQLVLSMYINVNQSRYLCLFQTVMTYLFETQVSISPVKLKLHLLHD